MFVRGAVTCKGHDSGCDINNTVMRMRAALTCQGQYSGSGSYNNSICVHGALI